MNIVYLNGEYLPHNEAKVSIFDRGFLFGDGVYEVIPVFDGVMIQADEHLSRLENSLQAIEMRSPLSLEEWKQIFKELIKKNNKQHQTFSIYLQVTRGVDETRSYIVSPSTQPTVLAFCMPVKLPTQDSSKLGFSAITLEDNRRYDCFIKAINLLPNVMLYEQARKANAIDAILIRDKRFVTEATSSNVFIVKGDRIKTPRDSRFILNGITRQLIIQLARENDIICEETHITPDQLFDADEIWLTGSTKEICPIVILDGKPVGTGQIGPMYHRMMGYYNAWKIRHNEKTKVVT